MKGTAHRALIFGVTGQDGSYLADFLLQRGYHVHGTSRSAGGNTGNLRRLGIAEKIGMHAVDLQDARAVDELLAVVRPSEIYNLAGQSSVGLSFAQPKEAFVSSALGTLNILEAIRKSASETRFFSASSSEALGDTGPAPAGEDTPFRPATPYGVAKAAVSMLVKTYRDSFGLFACSGIMFNHESPLRSEGFVTQRIVRGAIDIAQKKSAHLSLGNLSVVRDWGWAPDFVESMWMMLQHTAPEDFVVATGIGTSLEQFVDLVFAHVGLQWKEHVVLDQSLVRPRDIPVSIGDPERIRQRLGWKARVRMPELAGRLVDAAQRQTVY